MALPQFLSAVIWLAEVVKHSGHTGSHQREELQALTETANRQRSLAMRRAVGGAGVGEKLERFLHEEIDSCVHKRATQLIGLVAKQHLGEQRVLARFWEGTTNCGPFMPLTRRKLLIGSPGTARRIAYLLRTSSC